MPDDDVDRFVLKPRICCETTQRNDTRLQYESRSYWWTDKHVSLMKVLPSVPWLIISIKTNH